MADIANKKKLKEIIGGIDMSMETEILELNAGLREIETFLGVFEDCARDYESKERLDYTNGVLSMISMQSAKLREIIEIAAKLESELNGKQ